jgi:hypothetical protein
MGDSLKPLTDSLDSPFKAEVDPDQSAVFAPPPRVRPTKAELIYGVDWMTEILCLIYGRNPQESRGVHEPTGTPTVCGWTRTGMPRNSESCSRQRAAIGKIDG